MAVSELHKAKLRQLAYERNFGGNRYTQQREYTNQEINDLFYKYSHKENKLESLFSNKILKNEYCWLNDLSRFMSRYSKEVLLLLINPRKCHTCKEILTPDNYPKLTRKAINCIYCYQNQRWKTKQYRDPEKLKLAGEKISTHMKKLMAGPTAQEIKDNIGRKNSINMKKYMQTETGKQQRDRVAKHLSNLMVNKILAGHFTPCVTNSRTHWSATIQTGIEIKKFRSSWEACFWFSNQHLLYEYYRIPYYDKNNKKRAYVVDFFDINSKTVYEIKPIARFNEEIHKMTEAIKFCIANQVKFIWINENNIMQYIDTEVFKEHNLKQLQKLQKGLNAKVRNKKY